MGHLYTDTRPTHPAVLADMKLELLEAEEDMQKKWVTYRNTRPNAAALDAYTTATERCPNKFHPPSLSPPPPKSKP